MITFYRIIDAALRGVHPAAEPMTEAQMAILLGCSQSAVHVYRTGASLPPNVRIPDIAIKLGYPVDVIRQIVTHDRAYDPTERIAAAKAYYAERNQRELEDRRTRETDLYPAVTTPKASA